MLASALCGAALLIASAPATAQTSPEPIGPWEGRILFNCNLQDVGTGTDFPDPDADPFCVEYDKTSQNVTDFGLVDFLSKEPARVAAATPKCFYHQRDHWTGSVDQESGPETWHWDGNYFFDKAKGIGGTHVANFRIGGQPSDPRPYVPEEWKPFFTKGGGGWMSELESGPDPRCAARVDTPEEREEVYRDEPVFRRCAGPGGEMRGHRVGNVKLGMERARAWRRLGAPRSRKNRVQRWCLTGGGQMRIAFRRPVPRAAALILTTNRGHELKGIGPGTPRRRAIRRLDLERRFRAAHTRVYEAPRGPKRRLFAGMRGGRVRWLAITDPNRVRSPGHAKKLLRRAR